MKFDACNRRKRQHRVSTGANHQIQPRDIEIFRLLQRYRYLRTRQIRALLPGGLRGRSDKRFRERLGFLFHEGYLARPEQQRLNLNFYYADSIYALDARAVKLMTALGLGATERGAVGGGIGAGRQFAHAMMIVDSVVAIELGASADPNTSFVPWAALRERMPAATRHAGNPLQLPKVQISWTPAGRTRAMTASVALIPDAAFAIRYPTGYVLYLLEAEHRDNVRRTDLAGNGFLTKALAYRELRRRRLFAAHFGTNTVVVLTVAPTPARVRSLLATIGEITEGHGSTMFAFHGIPVFAETVRANPAFPPLYEAPWQREGHPPFRLDAPS